MKKGKIITLIIIGLFIITLTNAQTLAQMKDGILNMEYTIVQTCFDASYMNVTIHNINGIIASNIEMIYNGSGNFIYNFTPTLSGRYDVSGISDGCTNSFASSFEITPTGSSVDTGETLMYISILVSLIILIALGIYVSIIIPYENIWEHTRRGKVITAITFTKYMKIIMIWITSGIVLIFLTVLTGMVNNYIQFVEMKALFTNIYTFINVLGYGLSVTIMIVLFLSIYKDLLWNAEIRKHGKAFIEKNIGSV